MPKLVEEPGTLLHLLGQHLAGEALRCGHLIPEELPDLVVRHFRCFFAT